MKSILAIISFISMLSCNRKKEQPVITPVVIEKKIVEARADSVNEEFLSRAVYDTAMFYNNSPTSESEFLLNEKKLAFQLSGLNKSFTEKQKMMPIVIKEVTWKLSATDLITVFYVEKKVFLPGRLKKKNLG